MAEPADAFVQLATDGSGKKAATREFTRADGALVEVQQVLSTDPTTGRPLDAPPWAEFIALQKAILAELRVLTSLFAADSVDGGCDLAAMREHFQGEIQ